VSEWVRSVSDFMQEYPITTFTPSRFSDFSTDFSRDSKIEISGEMPGRNSHMETPVARI
jgi:hypothetical protein